MKKLEVNHIRKTFRQRAVVDGVSLGVRAGEIVGLLGPNGAGKTTTFLMILGIQRPDSGEILLNGRDITRFPVYSRSRLGISFLPQEPSVFRGLSVEDNIRAIAQMTGRVQESLLEKILSDLGLEAIRKRKAYMLSGGERRRLEIARSLILAPDFLLLDEPFSGIDPIQIVELQELIRSFKAKNMGIIITDHNVREILKITDRSYIIHSGQVIFEGRSEELIADERVKKEYLGKEFRWN
ncbi:MAG: LPS export ABC transporter ATP-binding protein [Candidatus Aminicenantes bacterium]|nr:LPS export ABC transporter ATP-binding protein [Acidobacteriota bacterium]MCG2810217.1 LPS export ABC transporter ATP-binding protein [Candidatus Aminicenantes bacterium]